jgi:membrane-bound lytic murein transglycosylase D
VQRGESLSEIAARVGMSESQLLQINKIRNPDYIFEGQQLRLAAADVAAAAPASASGTAGAGAAAAGPASTPAPSAGGVTPAVAERESEEDAAAVAASAKPQESAEPVSAAQAEALSPALGPAADETPQSADPLDYGVAKDSTIVVAATETLGHYADWLRLSATRLRNLNHMRPGRPVLMGHRVKLDFTRVAREAFEDKRREYHRTLEAGYFAAHRITGTEVYIARRGDSLWTVTQRYEHLPVWLLQQYNPDVDFSEMRAGTQLVVPKVEDVTAAGG